jgi:hypothetical protein
MNTAVAAQAGRTTDRIAVVSGILHAGLVGFGIFLANQSGSQNYLLLSGAAALGLIATLLGWASVKAGSATWSAGVVAVGLSLGVLASGVSGEGGLGLISFGITMVFLDYLVFSNARRAFS